MTEPKLQLVVLDWAGTAVDFGSVAPILALEHVFAAHGIPVPRPQLRLAMGLAKKDHIREILALPTVAEEWQAKFGQASTECDVETLYAAFTPRMIEEIEPSATLIPGIAEFAAALRARHIKLGATTGYTRPMMETLARSAAAHGYAPDLSLCPDDVPGGRPNPWMCFKIAIQLKITSLSAAVKIGDTPSDIAEGLNAGMWTIGVTSTGNGVGLTQAEYDALTPAEQTEATNQAEAELFEAGAHYVIDSAANALPILDEIEAAIAAGNRP
jgi:phosphonoacetaldehyde hydrolase